MEKETRVSTRKDDDRRDDPDRGVIVAGPDAHANESAGATPPGRDPKGGPAKKPEGRS